MGAQRTESGDLVHIYWLTDAFDLGRPERLESKVALAQLSDLFGGCNRAARGQRLQPGGETDGMANGSILGVPLTSCEERTTTSPVFTPTRASIGGLPSSRSLAAWRRISSCMRKAV